MRFRFLIRRSCWVTPGFPPFLLFLFLVGFLFRGGFPVSYFFGFGGFPISLLIWVFYFLIGAFLFFPFPPDPPDVHEAQRKEGTPIRSRSRGRGAPKVGGIEVSRDSRSVQLVFRASH